MCAPFKHILGDYLEALELGADVLVQFAGPCRLGYYGELQESILRDMGYEFEMLNFATAHGQAAHGLHRGVQEEGEPEPVACRTACAACWTAFKMIECLDEAQDFYLAHAGFEAERGSFDRALAAYHAEMRAAANERDIAEAQRRGLESLRALPVRRPARPVRVGVVGEYFTAADPHSNLGLERKLLDLGVEVHRQLNMTNRNLRYNERNLRAGISDYVRYDMGPTSSMTIAAALQVRAGGLRRRGAPEVGGLHAGGGLHPRAAAGQPRHGPAHPVPELRLADQ